MKYKFICIILAIALIMLLNAYMSLTDFNDQYYISLVGNIEYAMNYCTSSIESYLEHQDMSSLGDVYKYYGALEIAFNSWRSYVDNKFKISPPVYVNIRRTFSAIIQTKNSIFEITNAKNNPSLHDTVPISHENNLQK